MPGFNEKRAAAGLSKKKRAPAGQTNKPSVAKNNSADVTGTDNESEDDFGYEEDRNSSAIPITAIVIGIAVIIVVIAGIFIFTSLQSNNNTNSIPDVTAEGDAATNQPNQVNGEPNNVSSTGTMDTPVTEPVTSGEENVAPFDADVTNSQTNPVWIYSDSKQGKDFCNYEKHRSVMGNGLELYWLDCTYKDMPYKIQVDFETYALLDTRGIVPIILERTITDAEVEIITCMTVDVDYLKRVRD